MTGFSRWLDSQTADEVIAPIRTFAQSDPCFPKEGKHLHRFRGHLTEAHPEAATKELLESLSEAHGRFRAGRLQALERFELRVGEPA